MSQLPGWTPTGSVTSTDPRGILPSDAPIPSVQATDSDQDVQRWDQYLSQVQALLVASSGYQRMALERQYEDAKKGRQNALRIAQLQAETSRYGVDRNREVELARLKENARQFDQNHGLEQQKLGLDYAKTATEYLATPDRHFRAANYINMGSRVLAGQPGVAPYGGTPTPKTDQDFAILTRGGNPYASTPPAAGYPDSPMAAAASGGAGADARIKMLKTLADAAPPSSGSGYDANDFAALRVAQAIYGMNLTPKQQATLAADPALQAMHQDAGRNLGYDVDSWEARQKRSLPGQGSVRAA